MHLSTTSLLQQPATSGDLPDMSIGLADLRKGIWRILLGYLTIVGTVAAAVGLLVYVSFEMHSSGYSRKAAEGASTIVFTGILVFGLLMLFSMYLILRGKWLCLMNAPERHHAKWLMYCSILCVLVSPALNIGSQFAGVDKERDARMKKAKKDPSVLLEEIEEYKRGKTAFSKSDYVKLAGDFAGVLSTVFFVLFLRAVALCCESALGVRCAELYLLFSVLLMAGLAAFLWKPSLFLARPQWLLALGLGWAVSGLWYLLLILGIIGCISSTLDKPRSSLSAQ